MVLRKNKFNSFVAATLCSVMTLSPAISAIAADMPTGGSVQSGNVKIAAIDPAKCHAAAHRGLLESTAC